MIRPGISRLFRVVLRGDPRDADVDDEIRTHLELREAQLIARGMSPAAAREEAHRRFGAVDDARRELKSLARRNESRMRMRDRMDALRQDLSYAARSLARDRGFAFVVMLTLALGIGANALMFGVLDRVLLSGPAHVRDARSLARVFVRTQPPGMGEFTTPTVGYITYATLERARSFEGVAGYAPQWVLLDRGPDARQVRAIYATWTLFPLLGVSPSAGRFFGRADDRVGAQRVVVLGHNLARRIAPDRDPIGMSVLIASEPHVVIGVAPAGFTGADLIPADLWIPMAELSPNIVTDWQTSWSGQWMEIIARLKPGVSPERAADEATALHQQVAKGSDPTNERARIVIGPLSFGDSGRELNEVSVARWVSGVAVIVLLIACANVANLMLARGARRRREIAVRMALGISRLRLMSLLLLESLMLAIAGGALGLLIAAWGGRYIRAVLLPDVEWTGTAADPRVVAFTAVAILVTAVLTGLAPALQAGRHDLTASLKAGAREGGGQHSALRTALTVTQAALSAVLLVGAVLFVKSLREATHLDLGIEPERVVLATVRWPGFSQATGAQRRALVAARAAFYRDALARLRRNPLVEHAAISIGTPFHSTFGNSLRVPGIDSLPKLPGGGPFIAAVTPDLFATMGNRIVRGRDFQETDRPSSERVVIVNETMAAALWPNEDPLSRCLIIGGDTMPCARVVGVVRDTPRYKLRDAPAMQYYVPFGQETGFGGPLLLMRIRGRPQAAIEPLRREIIAMNPNLDFVSVRRLQEDVDPLVRPWRLGATLFGVFGGLALLVAAVGLYSVVAYNVAQRRHEFGVRLALGARPADLVRMVVGEGVLTAGLGIAIGLLAALAAAPFVQRMLFETSARSPAIVVAVGLTMLIVAAVASLIPSRRAMRVEPVSALRDE